jgi:pyruvate dehydrogenase E1 component alpha subunit
VPVERQTASATFADKAVAYGIRGVRCDGNDLWAVYKVVREAVARAAAGEGATLVEAITYRLSGHSTSDDPKAYRKDDVVEVWRRRDPVLRARRYLEGRGLWSDGKQSELEASVDARIKAAVAQAEAKPPPPLESMFDDVFAELPWHLREQRAELLAGPRAKGHGH